MSPKPNNNDRTNDDRRHNSDRNDDPQRPVETLRDGNIKSSIWRNTTEKGAFYAATFARSYTDRDGNVRDATGFAGTDLLKLSELARKTYDRTGDLRREDFKKQRQAEGQGHVRGRNRDRRRD